MADFISIVPKDLFFDRKLVIDKVAKGKRNAFSKQGAFVRTRMKSITGRSSSKTALPGQAPKRHKGQLHDLIFFALTSGGDAVDIGPVKFGAGEAPELNEFGGKAIRRQFNPRTRRHDGKKYTALYKPHPFAKPSLDAEIAAGTIASSWAGAVRN